MPGVKNVELHEAQNERLTRLIASLGMSENEFSRQTGLAYNYLFQFRKYQSALTDATANKIKAMMPNLSLNWLRFGVGDQTTDGQPLKVRNKEFVGASSSMAVNINGDVSGGEVSAGSSVKVAEIKSDLPPSANMASLGGLETGYIADCHKLIQEKDDRINSLLDRIMELQDKVMQQQETIAKSLQNHCDKMANVIIYLDTRHLDKAGNAPLKLVFSHKNKSAMMPLGVSLSPSDWDASLSKVVKRRDRAFLNTFITQKLADAKSEILHLSERGQLNRMTASEVRDHIKGLSATEEGHDEGASLLMPYFEAFRDGKTASRTREIYDDTIKALRRYCGNVEAMRFDDVTVSFLNGFNDWLAQSEAVNTRSIHMRNLRAVMNAAINDELTANYPFRKFKIRHERTRKRNLTREQVVSIMKMQLPSHLDRYRDYFLIMLGLIGINGVDLCHVKGIGSDGRLDYARSKTSRQYSVKVEPEVLKLIEKHRGNDYLLDAMDGCSDYRHFMGRLNLGLHTIGERIGVPNLTSYYARHTWASLAAELDIPKETIGKALGHSDSSVTDIYIAYDYRKVDEANRKVLDYISPR